MGLERDELTESPYPEKFLNFVQIDGEWLFEENLGGKFGDRAHFFGVAFMAFRGGASGVGFAAVFSCEVL